MRDWLAARAAATPRREALVAGGRRLSFAELNRRVARRCALWQAAGLRPGQHLGMVMHGSEETIVSLFAALRLGLLLVPLGTRQTEAERLRTLRHAGCAWLLTETGGAALWQLSGDGDHMPVSSLTEGLPGAETAFPGGQISLTTPLAIVHTSGTTGSPKGAVLTAGNFYYSALGATMRLGHLPQDRWLCVMPLWHVGGLSLIIRAIIQGSTVVLHSRFDPEHVMHALRNEGITMVSLVPTMLHRLLENCDGDWPRDLRLVLLGGAPASGALMRRSAARGLPVAPTWGLTETCSQATTLLPEEAARKPASVGKPLLFTSLRIVAESGEEVATDEIGQIAVRGPTVMQGYWNDPPATAQALVYGELRTGDLGYVDGGGDLFVVQRRSELINSGGENVYPREIECALAGHSLVDDAVVLGLDDEEWGQRVAAVVQIRRESSVAADLLSDYLRRRLAAYKLPRAWRFVDSIPRSASGKVNRRELKQLFQVEPCPDTSSAD